MEDFVGEINDKITTNFKVNKIPVGILRNFKDYCESECGDTYWVGIHQLMKTKEQYENLLVLFSSLQSQINEIKEKLNSKEIRRFGK